MEDTVAETILEKLKKLDAERSKLLEGAKTEALAKANQAVEELNAIGFSYELVENKGEKPRKARKVDHAPKGTCPICKYSTNPPHDARSHRAQQSHKKPFTDDELAKLGMVKA